MNEHEKLPWRARLRHWLLDKLYSQEDGWTHIPVADEDMPVVVVPMRSPEYQALILWGYNYPERQEIDWDAMPPYDMPEDIIIAAREEGLKAMRAVIRQRIAEWEAPQ